MPGLTLVTGPYASGKTERLVTLAAERYREDPFAPLLVLTPTIRHADQFRQRLVERAGVALGLEVLTLNHFAARVTADEPFASPEVAQELLARVTREAAAGDGPAARLQPIAHTRGLHELVAAAIGDLIADHVTPEGLTSAAGRTPGRDLPALAEVFERYAAELAQRDWLHPQQRASVAAKHLSDAMVPPLVLIDGVQFLRGGEVDLVRALAERTVVWMALDPGAGERSAWTLEALTGDFGVGREELPPRPVALRERAYTAADAEAELREIARDIKQQLAEDPALRPSDCAVVYRQVTPHLATARRVFAEYRLPLDAAAGEPLTERPFGVWLLRLLRLGLHEWRTFDVIDVLASGFANEQRWGFHPGDLDRVRGLARERQLWAGEEALRALGGVVEGERVAAAWTAAADQLTQLLDPAVERTPAAHVALLDAALFGQSPLVRATVEGYDTLPAEAAEVRAAFRALRAVEDALGSAPLTFEAFVDLVASRMDRPSTMIRAAGGVLLAPAHTVHGLRFHSVHIGGLVEGEFPARRSGGAFLGREDRELLAGGGLALPPEPRASEDELWRAAVGCSDAAVTYWRPRRDGSGRPAPASFYFDLGAGRAAGSEELRSDVAPERAASERELALSLAPRWPDERRRPTGVAAWDLVVMVAAPIEQRRRSWDPAGRHEGALHDVPGGVDVDRLVAPEAQWSASRLESYLTCPFQFFAGYALRLHPLDQPLDEPDAAIRGTVIHDILDDALRPLIEADKPLTTATVDRAVDRLRAEGAAIWDRAPEERGFGRAGIWRYQVPAMLDRMEAMLRREAAANEEAGVVRILGVEHRAMEALPGIDPPLRVLARIDRVDELADGGVQIVDYKSGKEIIRKAVENGELLQLQLYAAVMLFETEAERVVARYSFLRPPRTAWQLDSADGDDRAILDAAAGVAARVRDDVAGGRFPVAPSVTPCPDYCDYRTVCRVNHFSRWKQWT
jgi:ATP-dependent helicase/nuclease subunit B